MIKWPDVFLPVVRAILVALLGALGDGFLGGPVSSLGELAAVAVGVR